VYRRRSNFMNGGIVGMQETNSIARHLLAVACLVCISTIAVAGPSTQPHASSFASDPALQSLRTLLRSSDTHLDFGHAKLTIDRLIDPTVDVPGTLQQLDDLAAIIRARFPAAASNRAKLDILLSSLYQSGPWNDHRPFAYDLDDPLGRDFRNKLISVYLARRKGNCISMPILFAILGQKLGLPVTLATAPEHVLAKFLDQDGHWLNVEATAGGFKFDSSYERETGISSKAIENAIYLRPLSQRESVAVMMATLMEIYNDRNQQTHRIAVADLALEVDPKDVVAMIHKATGYYKILRQRYHERYPRPIDIPLPERSDFEKLSRDNLLWFAKAEALGWTMPTAAQQAAYMESIRREKANHKEKK
jgi:regulator of sirC expression with transglutaminase-like and TPR domain